ncbi:NHLP leader peptide family RiPP precursor [Aquimarina sp. 2201CG1-2-11]|uniref:NHLP leader peptide family RiPP precursor n=1 Tax=Aquimarina discodermiae TaxID=3231043 RepID=UPI00346303B1
MEHTTAQKKAQEFLNSLITKAWEDAEFKKRLMANPKEEIQKITGKEISIDKEVLVTDQTNPDHIYINIPAKPNLEDVELTDDQLEAVSGGVQHPVIWLYENVSVPIAKWLLGVE